MDDGVALSTPPRGGDSVSTAELSSSPCFNPRPRAGGDSRRQ